MRKSRKVGRVFEARTFSSSRWASMTRPTLPNLRNRMRCTLWNWSAVVALAVTPAFAQSVPDTIAVEGVPEVPKELARQLARYQNVRLATFQDWVPGTREMLVMTRFAD